MITIVKGSTNWTTVTIPPNGVPATGFTYKITINGPGIHPISQPAQNELELDDAQKKIDAYDRAMKGVR